MATYSAMTVLAGEAAAQELGEALEALSPAPTGVGVFEIEDGRGLWEVAGWFLVPPDIGGLAILAHLHGAADFVVSRVEDRDWVAQVRRELHPVEAGRFTVHGAHDAHRVGAHRLPLLIEAAMAFGTGHHGTTRGCLLALEALLRRGIVPRRVLDVGCGTGVLAMGAARAVRARCLATDIDAVAVATAAENVRANRLGPWVRTLRATGFRSAEIGRGAPYDLIFANILAAPLKRMAADIAGHLCPGGSAVLSGLLVRQGPGVEAVFRGHGLVCRNRLVLGDWITLTLTRTSPRQVRPQSLVRPAT